MEKQNIRIGIVGYGNLGKGTVGAIAQNSDMELTGIFTRRNPKQAGNHPKMFPIAQMEQFRKKIDVMILCGGSAKDLPQQVTEVLKHFHTVDSFDTHAKIPEYFARVDEVARKYNTLSLISCGWDPGLFSITRLLGEAVLPQGSDYTFWGKGLSQGHSDAVRRVAGVKNGVQYTVPLDSALEKVRSGSNPQLSTRDKHERICYVVAEEGADTKQIEHDIVSMPHYFKPYKTLVHFITEEELAKNHSAMPHGGHVIRTGVSKTGKTQTLEFSLALESNPDFTSSVLVAYARAIARMAARGETGARTVFDIPPAYLSVRSPEELRRDLL